MSFSRPHPFPHHDNSASIGGASCRRIHYRPSDRTAAAAAATTTNGDLSRKHHLGVDHTAFDAAAGPPLKRRRQQQHRQPVYAPWEETHRRDQLRWQHRQPVYAAGNGPSTSGGDGRRAGSDGVIIHGDGGDMVFMSRDEIERCSPSRRDGIDSMRETQLRYSYCAFLQNLGLRLQL
ncbi:Cyclin-T1-1 [Acorus gramineus]|uniref:Cyclin-T1-1 n=1 Tax=Acorus gramineus TaxID=55184 RepID=A0AAV9BPS5_ACOGR|nr:Cyclin-T1-1 [Acorus gramineus]